MFQKIVYDVVLSEQTNYNGEYMLMVRATQQCRYVDIPTNIYVRKYQFKNGLVTDKHKQYEGLNAMIQNIVTDIQATEIEAYRKGVEISPQKIYTIYVEHISTNVSLSEFTEQVLRFCSNRKEITKERYRSCVEYGTLPKTHQQGGQLVFKLGQTRQEKSPLEDGGIHLVF